MVGTVEVEPIVAEVNTAICSGCGLCISVCPYHAIELDVQNGVAKITDVLCKGCGACVSACPSGAAQQRNFTDQQIFSMIDTAWGEW
jgi:heterodisulfide reductase subunit A